MMGETHPMAGVKWAQPENIESGDVKNLIQFVLFLLYGVHSVLSQLGLGLGLWGVKCVRSTYVE